ncbi:MAG: hydantoinase/oxoprolinase family protein, partial [Peptostreptococcaceae bacterium]
MLKTVEELFTEVPISLSHEIGSVSLLERENATILNAALSSVAKMVSNSFKEALKDEKLEDVKIYLGQNDGTLMSLDYAIKYPILTIACGPTNSIRGASFLSNKNNAIVVDVGGTTTDVGVLVNSFPR